MTKPLRETMPKTAAFIDFCREAFGADEVNAAIRRGMQGHPDFHAVENGQEIGTPCPSYRVSLTADQIEPSRPPCIKKDRS